MTAPNEHDLNPAGPLGGARPVPANQDPVPPAGGLRGPHISGNGVKAASDFEGYWYLATPFTAYPHGHEAAFRAACVQAGLLKRAGIVVFSPIVHSYPLVKYGGVTNTDYDSWRDFDEAMIAASVGLIVCKLAGWDISVGVRREIEFAGKIGKSVVYMEPGEVPAELRALSTSATSRW